MAAATSAVAVHSLQRWCGVAAEFSGLGRLGGVRARVETGAAGLRSGNY